MGYFYTIRLIPYRLSRVLVNSGYVRSWFPIFHSLTRMPRYLVLNFVDD